MYDEVDKVYLEEIGRLLILACGHINSALATKLANDPGDELQWARQSVRRASRRVEELKLKLADATPPPDGPASGAAEPAGESP